MQTIIRFSVKHPWIILMILGLSVGVGVWSLFQLPVDAVPDITNKQVQINTSVEGLAPEQIEKQVTIPVEISVGGIPGVTYIRSLSRPRLSQVTVVFRDNVDLLRARQFLSERLQGLSGELPNGAVPELGPISTGLGEIYFYLLDYKNPAKDLEARKEQLMELMALQDWMVKPRLLRVSGVAEVSASGGYERQAVVQPDMVRMASRGIKFDDLAEALGKAARTTGGGLVERGAEQFSVAVKASLTDLETLKKLPVKSDQSLAGVKVSDIAEVHWGSALRTGASTAQGQEGLLCTALMLSGENGRSVAKAIDRRISEIAKDLPSGVELKPVFVRSHLVDEVLGTVVHNLVFGAILVVIVLVLFMGNFRAALITAMTIPMAMLFAVTVMVPLGISGNLMSLGAIDFGILVYGAVIVMDHCVRQVAEHRARRKKPLTAPEIHETIAEAAVEIRTAAGFGQLIILTALLPLFGLTGVEAKTFVPMVVTLALGLIGAWIFSFTGAIALACLFLSGKEADEEPKLVQKARDFYRPILDWSIKSPLKLLVGGLALLVLTFFLYSRLGAVFMPHLDEGSLAIQFVRPVNISMTQALKMDVITEKLLLEFPQVDTVFSRTGTPEVATDPMGVHQTDTYVLFKPKKAWPKDGPKTKEKLTEAILERLKSEVPGQRFLVTQPIEMRFNELLEGTRAEIAVKVYGNDLGKLSEIAGKVAEVVRQVSGAGDVELESEGTSPVLSVEPRLGLLSSIGVTPGEIMNTVEAGLAGKEVGKLYGEGGRWFPVVVRLSDALREDSDVLARLPVGLGGADTRPLGDLADIHYVDTYSTIVREQGNRRAAVLVNTRGRDVESFVMEAQQKVAQSIHMPDGYYLEWGGSFENLQQARARLIVLTPLALLLVLAMVYTAFRNMELSILVFAGVPLALIGGVAALAIRGMPFSISAGVGFIALAGIAVLNGIVLISNTLALRRKGVHGAEATRKAALDWLRPVLETALVEIFGFLPMMFSTGLGAEVQQPLATVVVGGILSSTILTLLTLPSWQTWVEQHRLTDRVVGAFLEKFFRKN